ncbi:MAG: DUF2666 family protein [Candidatus Diapherotrites archaeon]|nr:DUF2666 family protein [Candidatus Diapherotrites archaeon]
MEKVIQFLANYDDWQAVKKLKIEEKTDPRTIMEFLASLGTGIDNKIALNIGKIVDLKKLDAAIGEVQKGKGREQVAEIIAEVNSRKVNGVINEICAKEGLQKNEQKKMVEFCKVYAMKKAFKEAGIEVDYSGIDIPGMRKMSKAKV